MRRLLLAMLLIPAAAGAGPLSDLLMAPGPFAGAPDGPLLAYDETREVPTDSGLAPQPESTLRLVRIETSKGPALELSREIDGAAKPLTELSPEGANPVLLYFLEATVRDLSQATGGNPFYIRNRIREALVGADLGADATPREVALPLFAEDRNRERLGPYADLMLRIRFDEARPGELIELSMDTPDAADGYHHRLSLISED